MSSHENPQYHVSLVTTANLTGDAAAAKYGLDNSPVAQFPEVESYPWYGGARGGSAPQQQMAYPDSLDLLWVEDAGIRQATPLAADYSHSDVELSAQTSFGGDLPPDPFPWPNAQIVDPFYGISLTPMGPSSFHDVPTSQGGTPPPGTFPQWQIPYEDALAHNHHTAILQWQGQSAEAALYVGAHPPVDPAGYNSYAEQAPVGVNAPPEADAWWGAPNINESSNGCSPTTQDAGYNNAGNELTQGSLRHCVAGEGNTLGISGAVVGKHTFTQNGAELSRKAAPDPPASPRHEHPIGKKKNGEVRRTGHNCSDDEKELPEGLEKDTSGNIALLPLYKRLLRKPPLPTETFDRLIFGGAKHGVGPQGQYKCTGRAKVIHNASAGGQAYTWDVITECTAVLRDKDAYRRHVIEQHLAFSSRRQKQVMKEMEEDGGKDKVKHTSVRKRISRKIEEIEEEGERIGRKRKRGSDDDAGSGSSSGRAKRSKLGHMPTDV